MANYKIVFQGTPESNTENHELQCFCNDKGEIYIEIESDGVFQFICLDISTAIKLSKTLRTHINLAKEII